MIFLFSNKSGPLEDGAVFMQTKNSGLHPGDENFYLTEQQDPLHKCLGGLGPNSQFNDVNCTLGNGEAVIIIGHGGNDNRLRDEAGADVTDAALRLMAKIAKNNPDGGYTFFLAACGGGVRQPGMQTSLLSTFVRGTDALANQLLQGSIRCWGYTASTGLVNLNGMVPANLAGTHIYGTLTDSNGEEQHCGYDSRVTTRLRRLQEDGTYVTIFFSPALYSLKDVVDWVDKDRCVPNMHTRFPHLYNTIQPTSK